MTKIVPDQHVPSQESCNYKITLILFSKNGQIFGQIDEKSFALYSEKQYGI